MKKSNVKAPKVVGFQIVKYSPEYGQEIPDDFYSFEILTKKVAMEWIKKNDPNKEWEMNPIRYGEIEEPTYRRVL